MGSRTAKSQTVDEAGEFGFPDEGGSRPKERVGRKGGRWLIGKRLGKSTVGRNADREVGGQYGNYWGGQRPTGMLLGRSTTNMNVVGEVGVGETKRGGRAIEREKREIKKIGFWVLIFYLLI